MKKLIISFIALFHYLAFSQEEAKLYLSFKETPLIEVFQTVESSYDVKFSYYDKDLNEQAISLENKARTLSELLFEIEFLTQLKFEIIDDRYIIVSKNKDESFLQQLDKIVVTSYLTQGISKQKDASYQIRPNDLGVLPGLTEPDVLESIQLLPGVISPNETASGFLVRGGKMDQNRLIWDGINMYHKGHLFGMISPFNPFATKSVNFINKGTNPRYGERASSVIEMNTTTEIRDELKGQLGFNGINVDALIDAPIIKDKLGIQASVRSSYTNLYQTFTFDQLAEKVFESTKIEDGDNPNNDFSFLDYNIKLNYKPNSKNSFFVSFISINNELDYTGSETSGDQELNDILRIENYGVSVGWDKQWNPGLRQSTQAFFSEYELNYNFITSENGEQISDFEKRNVIFDSGVSTEFQQTINENHALNLGYQYVLKDVGYIFRNTAALEFVLDQDDSEIQTHSIYANYQFSNPKWFDLSIGARTSYFDELDAVRVEPRFLLYKRLFKNVALQLSGEIKNQIISEIDETIISDLALENRLWRLANGNEFPIINSQQLSLGFIYTNNGWTIDVDNYIKKLDNVTALSFGFLNPVNSQYNLGQHDIYGVDVFVKKRLNRFNAWFSYSFNNSESTYENLNNDEPFTSRSNVLHAFTTAFSYNMSNFQVALGWRWQTGKPFTVSTSTEDGFVFNNGINGDRLPDYHRLDLSSTYSFRFSKESKLRGKIGLSIRNVYSQDNLLSREYLGNNDFNNEIEQVDYFSLGFTPNIMFRVYW